MVERYDHLKFELVNICYNPEYCEYRCNPDCAILALTKVIPHEDERTFLAVHELTGLTPERWDRLTEITRIPWLERAIQCAIERAKSLRADGAKSGEQLETPSVISSAEPVGMTWQEAAKRMSRLQSQGEPWTSQHKMAEVFGCSSGTINKAIRETPELHTWAKRPAATAPKAQSINEPVTDSVAQSCEPNPADDAAIREFIENCDDPKTKAWFLSLSPEDQINYLDDPDQYQTVLGRKP